MSDYSPTTNQYVTAFFDTRADAERAIERVVAEGVSRQDIRFVTGNEDAAALAPQEEKGFFEKLGDFFMPDEDRSAYAEGLNRGGYLVSLSTTVQNRDRILDILDDEGTVDMDAREESWRAEGWTGERPMAADMPMTAGSIYTGSTDTGSTDTGSIDTGSIDTGHRAPADGSIEVLEEKLRVGKREVDHGRVRVRSYVMETPVEEQVSLHDETVNVQRKAVDRAPEAGTAAFADRTIEATETAEEAVVSKEARVTEEITLDKDVRDRTETVRDNVRHTEVEIEDERAKEPR
jgi:stress response protein YsnF